MNAGHAHPGEGDLATLGSPAKYSYCFTENVVDSPWPEYHVSTGLSLDQDAVTVFACEAPHNVQDHQSTAAARFMSIVADAFKSFGHNGWVTSRGNDFGVILCPEHAHLLASEGWTRDDAQRYLYHAASRPASDLERIGGWTGRYWPVWMEALALHPENLIPPVRKPENFRIFVAGGPGKHSMIMPSFGNTVAVTWPVAG
jgi:hypothetical protein